MTISLHPRPHCRFRSLHARGPPSSVWLRPGHHDGEIKDARTGRIGGGGRPAAIEEVAVEGSSDERDRGGHDVPNSEREQQPIDDEADSRIPDAHGEEACKRRTLVMDVTDSSNYPSFVKPISRPSTTLSA